MAAIAGIILAAGFSRRLGRSKQDLLLEGAPLLARTAEVALAAGLRPVVVVLREPADARQVEHLAVRIVLNGEAEEGMASSVRAGIRALEGLALDGAVCLACDQPLLRADHLQALIREPARTTASAYAGRQGVPAYFPAGVFPLLLQLAGDAGARSLLQGAAAVVDEDLALDIDTEADLRRAEELLRSRRG